MTRHNLEIVRGDTWAKTITLKDSEGAAVDLTGATITMTIRESFSATTTLISKAVTSHTDPTGGESMIQILASDWGTVEPGTYVYDIQIALHGGEVYTVLLGNVEVISDVTR